SRSRVRWDMARPYRAARTTRPLARGARNSGAISLLIASPSIRAVRRADRTDAGAVVGQV
ncbi:MAG: hypothetical protein ACRDPB_01295, partial [Nocardioidaceae bacterium]